MPPAIDLRSDTVTRPTKAMLSAMIAAEVGDDVLGDDPTVIELEAKIAQMLGKESACFVPSGTMANQTAIRALTEPGDEIVAHGDSHIIHYESGAPAALSGCGVFPLQGAGGQFGVEDVVAAIRSPQVYMPRSRLLVVENTHNRGGGTVWPLDRFSLVCDAARRHGLSVHLDGARLFNACVAALCRPVDYARHADTVSICFSKGLGAPVGSAVVGTSATIHRVRRFRKMFGGAMRQSGLLAAAAIHALDHHIERLADDHAHARRLGNGITAIEGLAIDLASVQTNMVFFEVERELGTAARFCELLSEHGVNMLPMGPQRVRAVTHLDVTGEQIERALGAIADVVAQSTAERQGDRRPAP
ncbi:MAG: aminotransferase class I/II-fold pyridoxal phosphate-dependent enzyme [Phycisphaerales bacterium]|nr:aminotransferase class I/II-fold pyridoxal phosphate-dependent enzyme [Phycisphaerales bacterium]